MIRSIVMSTAIAALLYAAPGQAAAQTEPVRHPTIHSVPAADPGDVDSIDSIVAALYDVISGPVGEARDWDRFRSLFVPGGKLMPTSERPEGGRGLRLLGVNDYIAASGDLLMQLGFREREIARVEEHFGNIAHVFSTYEGIREGDAEPFVRGINSIQLLDDGSRWWIVSVYWQGEGPDSPLPARYLPGNSEPASR